VSAARDGRADAHLVTVQPAGSALDLLAASLGSARASIDSAAQAMVQDPFDVDAILDLSTPRSGSRRWRARSGGRRSAGDADRRARLSVA
jgi:hypothetical protein